MLGRKYSHFQPPEGLYVHKRIKLIREANICRIKIHINRLSLQESHTLWCSMDKAVKKDRFGGPLRQRKHKIIMWASPSQSSLTAQYLFPYHKPLSKNEPPPQKYTFV